VRIKATIGGKTFWQLRELTTGNGWVGNPLEAQFGLGQATNIETLRIEWPSGTVQQFQNVADRQLLTVIEPSRLVSMQVNGTAEFKLQGGRGMRYDVQVSADLRTWSSRGALTITNFDGTAPIVEANTAVTERRFYRALLQP
jgi:hypothetical protein